MLNNKSLTTHVMKLSVIVRVCTLTVAGMFVFTSIREVSSSPRGKGRKGRKGFYIILGKNHNSSIIDAD